MVFRKKIKKNLLKSRGLYAITTNQSILSEYMGDFIAIMYEDHLNNGLCHFLRLPSNTTVTIPSEDIRQCLSDRSLEYVKKCPRKLYKFLKAQFDYQVSEKLTNLYEDSNNRR